MATVSIPPARTVKQRSSALEKANVIRKDRALLKVRISEMGSDGGGFVAGLVEETPAELASMRTFDMLLAVEGMGPTNGCRILAACKVAQLAQLGALTVAQRERLVGELRLFTRRPRWPKMDRKPPAPKLGATRTCRECGEQMRRATVVGLCGFCLMGGE